MQDFYNAFISYARADSKTFAIKIHDYLTDQGLRIWLDQNDIPLGVDFQNQIDDGIAKADNFIFIITPHAVQSKYCLKEINRAVELGKRIIPLLHINSDRFLAQMHPVVRKLNWIFFQEGINDFQEAINGLIGVINKHKDYVREHTKILIDALEWSTHQKQTRYLLIGKERQAAQKWLKVFFEEGQPPCQPTDLHSEFICESIKNANNLMTQVFISYATEDRFIMEKISKTLMRYSFTIWTNKTDIKTGTEFQLEINKGIEQADNFVYLLSYDTLNSEYCHQELEYAFANNKRIITLLIENININLIPKQLRTLQFIDLTTPAEEELYHQSIDKLLKELYRDAPYYEQHKILLVKALKWQRQNCNPSILLRGYNLQHYKAWLKVAQQHQEHSPLPIQVQFVQASVRQPSDDNLEVFISYSRADADFARQVNEALILQGKFTWFDQENIASGTDFQQEIHQGIATCDNFLFIISPDAVQSPYCAGEVEYAQKLNKRIVTILYRQVSAQDLPSALARIQWIDFNKNSGDFYANFSELIRTLDTDREYVHNHTKWLQRAAEWEQKQKNKDLLLRGSEFALAQKWLVAALDKEPPPTELQQEYINNSEAAIEAARQQEQRQKRILVSLLVLVSTAFIAAVGLGALAWKETQAAKNLIEEQVRSQSRYANLLSDSHQDLNAVIEGIRAGQLRNQLSRIQTTTRQQLIAALNRAIYAVREFNRLEGHGEIITKVNFSPDGQLIATASQDKTVKLWNWRGDELHSLPHQEPIKEIIFSPNSQLLATFGDSNTVNIWSTQGKLLKQLPHDTEVWGARFSRDSNLVATHGKTNAAKLWDWRAETFLSLSHEDEVWGVVFSHDNQFLATRSKDKTAKLWNRQGKLLQTLVHNDEVWQVWFSPNNQMLGTASKDKTAKIWDLQGHNLQTIEHEAPVKGISFSPDSRMLATYSEDQTSKLWTQGKQEIVTMSYEDKINGVQFSPDSQLLLLYGKHKTIQIWNTLGQRLRTLWHNDEVFSASFSSDGKSIATYSKDKTAKIWDRQGNHWQTLWHQGEVENLDFNHSGNLIATHNQWGSVHLWRRESPYLTTLHGHRDWLWNVAFSPDGELIATASKDNTVKLWSHNGTGKFLQHAQNTLTGHDKKVTDVKFTPDGERLVSASSGMIKLWTRQGEEIATFADQYSFRFSPDSQIIATSSAGKLTLWDRNGKFIRAIPAHEEILRDFRFSSNSRLIATGSNDATAKIWTVEGKQIAVLEGHTGTVRSVNFSPDGQLLATASNDQTVRIWQLTPGQPPTLLHTLTGHKGEVRHVSFSPDSQLVVTRSSDNTVKLWNRAGEILQTLTHEQNVYIYTVSFSPDGNIIATGGKDNQAKLWNLEGEELESLPHDSAVSRLSFHPDGNLLAAVSNQDALTVWHVDTQKLQQLEDRNQYLDDLMSKACDWVKYYLQDNPQLDDHNTNLCQGIGDVEN